MYRYFISYNFKNNKGVGFSNCEVQRNKKINNMRDIQEIAEEIIKKNSFKEIINYLTRRIYGKNRSWRICEN